MPVLSFLATTNGLAILSAHRARSLSKSLDYKGHETMGLYFRGQQLVRSWHFEMTLFGTQCENCEIDT